MRFCYLVISFLFFSFIAGAQDTWLTGKVSDADGNPVYLANIKVSPANVGTNTDKDGHFELKLPGGTHQVITISYVGFESDVFEITLKPGERLVITKTLQKTTTELQSIEVRDQQLKTNTFSRLSPKSITLIPTANASVEDLIKTLPGVYSRNELSSQYSVRGGNYDENLIFVDDIEIYRPFLVRSGQQEGQSFINPDLVSAISFSAGAFDAKYGDKMSSVLDIRYKKPTSFAASAELSFLGATAHVEGTLAKHRLSYLFGARYKTNYYIFKGLDVKGDYKPRYFDVQSTLSYEFSKKWDLTFFGLFSDNMYNLVPQSRETSFGTLDQAYKISIYFDGQEADSYQNWMTALTLSYKPLPNVRLRLISSVYQTFERETYDISAEYWLAKLETIPGEGTNGQISDILGVGAYLNHARNYLNGTVVNVEHRGSYEREQSLIQWGLRYEHEFFTLKMSEWEVQDSAGYSLPRPHDSLGSGDPPHNPLEFTHVIHSNSSLGTNKVTAFLQDSWTFKNLKNDIGLTAGLRAIYYDYSNQFLLNPRANVSLKPHWKKEMVFRLAAGIYSQPPTFREMTDLKGNLVPGLKAQTSFQTVLGSDLYFKAWKRPFKFVAEVYYKYIQNLIPYEVDNLQIRYYGTNDAHGYATGIDLRLNGEFVKGAESWISLSFMKTEEYFQGSWIPRPTDQRVNLSIFFQDYIPGFPTWKANLTLFYGTGLPFGPPDAPKAQQTLRIPPYRRVDLGLSKQLISEKTKFGKKNPLRAFTSMWIGLDIFNLLDINNTISYLWVTDVTGREYAVPNYLTPRTFNLKWIMTF